MNRLRTHTGKGILVAWLLLALPLFIIACGTDNDPGSPQNGALGATEIGAMEAM